MNKPQHPGERDLTIDTLERRQDYLRLIIASHSPWMRVTDDVQVKIIHRALIDLLVRVSEQYVVLLNALQKPRTP